MNPRSIKIDIQCIYVRRVIDHSCVDKFRMSSNALHPKKRKDAIDGADANLKSTKKKIKSPKVSLLKEKKGSKLRRNMT